MICGSNRKKTVVCNTKFVFIQKYISKNVLDKETLIIKKTNKTRVMSLAQIVGDNKICNFVFHNFCFKQKLRYFCLISGCKSSIFSINAYIFNFYLVS